MHNTATHIHILFEHFMHSILLEMWSIIVSWSLENTEDLTMVWTLPHVLWPAICLHMYLYIFRALQDI